MGVPISVAKTPTLPSPGHAPTEAEVVLLAGVGVSVANTEGVVVVGAPVGSDTLVKRHYALDIVRDGGDEHLARCLLICQQTGINADYDLCKTTHLERGKYAR